MQPEVKKILLFVGGVIVVVVVVVAAIFLMNQRQSPDYSEVTIDQDTGEAYVDFPNREPETEGSGGSTVIIGGGSLLLDSGFTQDQYNLVANSLLQMSRERLSDEYDRITFRPSDVKLEQNNLSTTIRLGDSDTLLPISIRYYELSKVEVHVSDRDNVLGGDFNSGVLVVTPEEDLGE
jgi:hypothetical protein